MNRRTVRFGDLHIHVREASLAPRLGAIVRALQKAACRTLRVCSEATSNLHSSDPKHGIEKLNIKLRILIKHITILWKLEEFFLAIMVCAIYNSIRLLEIYVLN